MSKMTGLPRSTIRSAKKVGYFAEWHRAQILAAAAKHDIPHTAFDYIAYLVAVPLQAPDHTTSGNRPSAAASSPAAAGVTQPGA